MALEKYNQKRDFSKTKEPKGVKKKNSQEKIFVVQHHWASKEHYDLRLEVGGVLKSWAVPKGPSYNPKDKRLAVMVEDHPYDYKDFEGIIKEGLYGAGVVMLFDEGTYTLEDNPKKSLEKGFLKFELHGKRLKGIWNLVHFKENNWLLIKEADEFKNFVDIKNYKFSVRSGKTKEEIQNKKININLTNPDKIIFPKQKITKKDLFNYYQKVAPLMLPYIANRLITTKRAPNGVKGDTFFKKHFNENKYFKEKTITNKEGDKQKFYYLEDREGLLNEVEMNGYEFHLWGSHAFSYRYPNMMVFDLDPDTGMPLSKVREGVRDLKKILDELNLVSFLKTSGGKGYHIVVPIYTIKNWQTFRSVAKNIAKLMEYRYPTKYVSNIRLNKRKGKILIDWVRNTMGSTTVAPYSIRIKNGSVSMPLKWSELDKIRPDEITIDEALKRIKRKDPWEGYFDIYQ